MFGANGTATVDGRLLQLRALDWDVDGKCVYGICEWIGYKDMQLNGMLEYWNVVCNSKCHVLES